MAAKLSSSSCTSKAISPRFPPYTPGASLIRVPPRLLHWPTKIFPHICYAKEGNSFLEPVLKEDADGDAEETDEDEFSLDELDDGEQSTQNEFTIISYNCIWVFVIFENNIFILALILSRRIPRGRGFRRRVRRRGRRSLRKFLPSQLTFRQKLTVVLERSEMEEQEAEFLSPVRHGIEKR